MASGKRPLVVLFLTVFIDLLGFGIVLPLLPRYVEHLENRAGVTVPATSPLPEAGQSPAASPQVAPTTSVGHKAGLTIGLLFASFSAMQFLCAPLWGRISDRIGRRPILLLGLAGSVVFYALFGLGSAYKSLPLMFVARIGAGIAGATVSIAQAYIADTTTPEKRTAGMALIGAAFGIGFTFGPILGSAALWLDPPSPAHLSPLPGYMAAGISLVALLLAFFYLPESLKPDSQPAERDWLSLHSLRTAIAMPSIGIIILAGFLAVFGFAQFESTLARVSKDAFHLDDRHNFWLFTYTGIVLSFAQGYIVRRMCRKWADDILAQWGAASMVLGMLGMIVSAYLPSLLRREEGTATVVAQWLPLVVFVLAVPVLITGFALLVTSTQALISRRSRADQQGGMLGLGQSAAAMARIIGPVTGNTLYDGALALPYLLSAGLMAAAAGLVRRLGRQPPTLIETSHESTAEQTV